MVLLVLLVSPLAAGGQTPGGERRRFEELKARAEKGEAQAQLDLGTLYATGIWVERDPKRAAKWHRKAAEQGLPRAEYQLGLDYAAGDGVKMDKAAAVDWFRRAAEQKLAEAQFSLGLCYANGRGVNPNAVEAARWFRLAAEQGYLDAESELGNCYLQGLGVVKDSTQGVHWIRQAAEKGSALAQQSLGVCYERGTGVPKDYVEAYKWYALAAAQDDEHGADIRVSLAKLETNLTPEQLSEAQRLAREFKPGQTNETSVLAPSGGAQAKATNSVTGFLNVTAAVENCEVFVDGVFVGNTPAKLNLADGTHVVEVKKAGFKGYRRELRVSAGSELRLRAELELE